MSPCGCGPACAAQRRRLIISKWAGHYDSSFTMKTYVHASDEDLKQGSQALAKIHRID
jgi:integrase